MDYYDDDVMHSIIYGDLDETEYETLIIHDHTKQHQAIFLITNGWIWSIVSLYVINNSNLEITRCNCILFTLFGDGATKLQRDKLRSHFVIERLFHPFVAL